MLEFLSTMQFVRNLLQKASLQKTEKRQKNPQEHIVAFGREQIKTLIKKGLTVPVVML